MKPKRSPLVAYPGAVAAALLLAGCSVGGPLASGAIISASSTGAASALSTGLTTGSATAATAVAHSSEQPVAPEQNPAGDIPDTQAFVAYHSPSGPYQLDVPEGWARTSTTDMTRFVSKLNGLQITLAAQAAAPSASADRSAMEQAGRAVQIRSVKDVSLPGGAAVLLDYTSNSDPNPVTGKQVRLEDHAYVFFHAGKVATLTLWAPLGADNVDQWNRIANSFRWQ